MAGMHDFVAALEQQVEWAKWSDSPTGQRMWASLAGKSLQSRDGKAAEMSNPTKQLYDIPLQHGELFYVSREFCDLVRHQVASLPDNATFQTNMLPAPVGFVWFAKPLELPRIGVEDEDAPSTLTMHAMGWCRPTVVAMVDGKGNDVPAGSVLVSCFMRRDDLGFFPLSYWHLKVGDNIMHRVSEFEESAFQQDMSGYTSHLELHEIRYAATLMLLMRQRLFVNRKEEMPRGTRRRMEKYRHPFSHIQVITLRRFMDDERYPQNGAGHVDWQCQWIVRGHWRQTYYPSLGAHLPKWIMPFLKGPKDKPLKDTTRPQQEQFDEVHRLLPPPVTTPKLHYFE